MTATLANRVPLTITTGRTVAAIPTDVPGLYVTWHSRSRTYAITHHAGQAVAYGFATAFDADLAADFLGDYADWEQSPDQLLDMPYRDVKSLARSIRHRGGYLFGPNMAALCAPADLG